MPHQKWISEFVQHLQDRERSPATTEGYKLDLEGFLKWLATQEITLVDGQMTLECLLAFKQYLCDKPLKPKSVNRKIASLQSFLKWAEQKGYQKERMTPLKRVREHKKGPRWLNDAEQKKLLAVAAANPRDQAMILLLLHTGLRVQELCSLKWQNVLLHDNHGLLIVNKGKGDKRREVPLNQTACQALQILKYTQHQSGSHIIKGKQDRMTPRGIQQLLKKHAVEAGLQTVTPHQLRHTFCKNLVNAGVGLEKIAMIAGHDSLESTRWYCEPSLQDLQQAVDRIAQPLQKSTKLYRKYTDKPKICT